MALYLVSVVFFGSDLLIRLALRARSRAWVGAALAAGLLLACMLYPMLSDWALPYMPDEHGMQIYAALVGLQLGLTDAAISTSLARYLGWWR
ncbi:MULTISPECIES: hypothetical protein [Chromobacterium]|uniref:Uncharacterized protein n=2 Tax=Chromobacterium TaxID=535 RepID=A0A1W0CNN5_9NEIS|nr:MULTISPECIES: hypothetical protein [Chromobacterium]AXT48763.1 hypothetical protein D1345_22505 [Chromobacterium rhizoryzae]MBK0417110.1 hypothetical protein [Chromobacterium haemolyticum]MBO0418236.1 hypothetical protein [Chromobacterium haemolyticum]MBO0501561.1 hypothetical protein [Chromobacterium haemolyticum]MDH0341432.1 hypothetical protein [Chromobacterium haemolyticum]